MPKFSRTSLQRLDTCDPRLQELFKAVVKDWDCTVLEGHRSKADQNAAYDAGRSKLRWPHGNHNGSPSTAVDVSPYPVDWKNLKRFYAFSGFVLGVAASLELSIRWGGDWNGNRDLDDQTFNDLVHFEILGGMQSHESAQ